MLRPKLAAIAALSLLLETSIPAGCLSDFCRLRVDHRFRQFALKAGGRIGADSLATSWPDKKAETVRHVTVSRGTNLFTERDRITAERLCAEGSRLRVEGTAASARIALSKYVQSLRYWRAISDKRGEARALKNLGEIFHTIGEPKKALEYYSRVLLLSHELGDRQLECEVLNDIAYAQIRLSQTEKALEYCTKALKLSQNIGHAASEARALDNIGRAYYAIGDRQQALSYYQQALPIWRSEKNFPGQAQTLLNFANVYSDFSYVERALEYYGQALALWRAVNDKRGEASTLTGMGHLYSRLGKKQAALELYEQARPLLKVVGDRIEEARVLNGLAYVYSELGGLERALDYYYQALRLFQATSYKRGQVGSLIVIGLLTYSRGDYKKALTCFQQALVMVRESKDRHYEAYALRSIAALHHSLGNKRQALVYYKQALLLHDTLGDPRGRAYALNGVAKVYYDFGDTKTALAYHNASLVLNRQTADRFGEVSTLFNIARIERDIGDLADARSHIEGATSKIEMLRVGVASQELRASFFATVRRNFELSIDLLMLSLKQDPFQGFEANALSTSEQARARSLLEMLVEARADIRHGVDASLLERERSLQQSLSVKAEHYSALLSGKHTEEQANAAAKEIDSTTVDFQQVQAQIRSTSPRYAALTQPQPLSLKEIQQQVLDSETILLEYALGDERSYLWAVTPDSLASFELPKRTDIEAAARRVYDLLTAQNQIVIGETELQKDRRVARADADYAIAAAALSQIVIGPVAKQLGNKRLVIVADGALQYIPFGALPVPDGKGIARPTQVSDNDKERSASNPQPLILEHEIVSLPSASTLAVMRRELADRKPAPRAVAVLADPVFSRLDPRVSSQRTTTSVTADSASTSRDFDRALKEVRVSRNRSGVARLPFSRREAEAIKIAAGPGGAMEAVDFDASRATATSDQLSQYRIIHFATHGLLNSEHPELSGLVFSLVDRQGKPQNGFLRLHEVYNLNLAADLVVLSACQTGLGQDVKGEGLVGLTRGFMYAGAARVIASLWQVDDSATAELMRRFYTKMLADGLRPAEALRHAQVEMSQQKRWKTPYYWAGFVLQGEWK
jgi:CHAT domain-containing protein/tetratricopeptide (TPR) repeat protein